MDLSKYTIKIDYSTGVKITLWDNHNKDNKFKVRIYIQKTKIQHKLLYNYNSGGSKWIEEECVNAKEFRIPWCELEIKSGMWYTIPYKGFVPYRMEVVDFSTDEVILNEVFDVRNKLVNFYLHSNNPETIHTWMCVIEKFKEENNCQISIINNYLKSNQKYDFVDSYWGEEENFIRYYAGYGIGRFGTENVPNFQCNPDGIKGKNDLEIIEDILYHYTKRI